MAKIRSLKVSQVHQPNFQIPPTQVNYILDRDSTSKTPKFTKDKATI